MPSATGVWQVQAHHDKLRRSCDSSWAWPPQAVEQDDLRCHTRSAILELLQTHNTLYYLLLPVRPPTNSLPKLMIQSHSAMWSLVKGQGEGARAVHRRVGRGGDVVAWTRGEGVRTAIWTAMRTAILGRGIGLDSVEAVGGITGVQGAFFRFAW